MSDWDLERIAPLMSRYYPDGRAWSAVVSEAGLDADINGWTGCQDVHGVAVDTDGNGLADVFIDFGIGGRVGGRRGCARPHTG